MFEFIKKMFKVKKTTDEMQKEALDTLPKDGKRMDR